MNLSPQFSGHFIGPADAPHSIQVFLDYACPFSKRMYQMLTKNVIPKWNAEHGDDLKIKLVFSNQVQPWHPQSTFLHEVSLIPELIGYPEGFKSVSDALFEHYDDFTDAQTYDMSRQQIYDKLLKTVVEPSLREHLAGKQQKDDNALDYLGDYVKFDKALSGNKCTLALKYHLKIARQLSVHVTPSVYIDGIFDSTVQSSYQCSEWEELLTKKFQKF
ncbi:hypothetical protein MIR68_007321 [Amoeboaphelidium protococcarum]|nr:hypothetical protein MIR68_007321 [Amoeboaphelidium protococcarum]